MTISLDTATISLIFVGLANLSAFAWYLARQGEITRSHEQYHREHRDNFQRLGETQEEHGKVLAVHSSILERHIIGRDAK